MLFLLHLHFLPLLPFLHLCGPLQNLKYAKISHIICVKEEAVDRVICFLSVYLAHQSQMGSVPDVLIQIMITQQLVMGDDVDLDY